MLDITRKKFADPRVSSPDGGSGAIDNDNAVCPSRPFRTEGHFVDGDQCRFHKAMLAVHIGGYKDFTKS